MTIETTIRNGLPVLARETATCTRQSRMLGS